MCRMEKPLATPHPKPQKPRNFFRAWRKHRGFTQEQLAGMIGVATASISQLETGKQGYTDSTLAALADALSCEPADLLMRNPLDSQAPWTIWNKLEPNQKRQFMAILETFSRNGTDG